MPVQIEAVAQAHSLGQQALAPARQLTPAEVAARPSSMMVREDPAALARAVVEVARTQTDGRSRRLQRDGRGAGAGEPRSGESAKAGPAQGDSRSLRPVERREERRGGQPDGRGAQPGDAAARAALAAVAAQRSAEARVTERALLVSVGVVSQLSPSALRRSRLLLGLRGEPEAAPLVDAEAAVMVASSAGAQIVADRQGSVPAQAGGLSTIAWLLLGV